MLSFDVLIWLLLAAALVWYWLDGMRSHEIARGLGRNACVQANVLLLDDTVALSRMRLRRNARGRPSLYREYRFEFTSDGSQRYNGRLAMLGRQLQEVQLDAYRIPPEQPYH